MRPLISAVRGGNFARQRQLEILASDMGDVLERDDIQLVVIATRHSDHAEQAADRVEQQVAAVERQRHPA